MVLVNVTSVFGQEKSQTKSLLNEAYKQNFTDRLDQLLIGKIDIEKVAEQFADSVLRTVLQADASSILDAVKQNISEGKVERPKLRHEGMDGKCVLDRSTIKAYNKCFKAFIAGLPRNVKKISYDDFVAKNKTVVSKAKSAIMKQFKRDLKKALDVKI